MGWGVGGRVVRGCHTVLAIWDQVVQLHSTEVPDALRGPAPAAPVAQPSSPEALAAAMEEVRRGSPPPPLFKLPEFLCIFVFCFWRAVLSQVVYHQWCFGRECFQLTLNGGL